MDRIFFAKGDIYLIGMKKLKNTLGGIYAGLILSLAIGFMLCIYAPFELYLTNQGEFWFDAKMMVKPALMLFACVFISLCAFFIVMRLIGKTPYHVSLALALGVLVYLYVQGNFLVSGLPPLDGTNIDWSAPSPERIKSIAAILVCLAAAGVAVWRLKERFVGISALVSGGLALMLAVTMTTLVLTTDVQDKTGQLSCYDVGAYEFSTEENFIVLVLDSVDAGTFEQALKKNPEFSDTFDDFTYFDNTLAAYPFSMHAVPHILTGQWYENEGDFHEYLQESMDSSPLIGALEKNDYRIGIYSENDIKLEGERFRGRFENQIALTDTFSSDKSFVKMIAKMAGLKYAPWDMKEQSYDMTQFSQDNRIAASEEEYRHFSWSNVGFYNSMRDAVTLTRDKTFRFIHLYGAHLPLWYNKDLSKAEEPTYLGNVEACLTLADSLIKGLKASGVYDNTSIVILADHGYIHPYTEDKIRERMHCPLLIKGRGEKGEEMKVSSAPISYADLAPSLPGLIEGKGAEEIFEYKDGDARERRFIWYCYTKEGHMEEYIATGSAREFDKMQPTGKQYDK